MVPNKARYRRTYIKAYSFIVNQNINSLPVDPVDIILKNKWMCKTFLELSQESGLPISQIKKTIKGSNDGGTLYCADTNEYAIIYNDRISSKGRIRWTLMHEIGHIVLGHFVDYPETCISRRGISRKKYMVLEEEADFFAYHVLAPPVVLFNLKVKSASQIQSICKLSKLASEIRFSYQKKWEQKPYIDNYAMRVLLNFYDFIYRKRCLKCGHSFKSKEALFCPICGCDKLKWGEGTMIYNDGYELEENGRAHVCPVCENEEMSEGTNYCRICGTYLINECPDIINYDFNGNEYLQHKGCGVVPGNARYCEICGRETTFYKNRILEDWRKAKKNIEEKAAVAFSIEPPF